MIITEDGDPNANGGNRTQPASPKKIKRINIPQRGLGIAALEKIRREEQQRKMTDSFATGDAIASSTGGSTSGHCTIFHSLQPQPNTAASFLPVLEPSSSQQPSYIGNYALFQPPLDADDGSETLLGNSVQNESFKNPYLELSLDSMWQHWNLPPPEHQQHQEQQRCSAMMNYLSPPLSSEAEPAGLQMELPSNQNYESVNPPPFKTELVSVKHLWPLQHPLITHGSPLVYGNELKRPALTREYGSSSNGNARIDLQRNAEVEEEEDAELDGSFLSLGPSEQSPTPTITSQQHYLWSLQSNQVEKSTESEDSLLREQRSSSEVARPWRPPPIYNFMELPDYLIGSRQVMQTYYPTQMQSGDATADSNLREAKY